LAVRLAAVLIPVLLAAWPARVEAQNGSPYTLAPDEPAAAVKEGKVLHAFRVVGNAPKIDGTLDDDVWNYAEVGEHLVQWDPDNMQPLSERTRFQVAYDDRFVYVAVRCDDRTPDKIARGLGRRDQMPPTDLVGIGFDPRHDHLTGYVFNTNPSGVQQDVFFFDDENADRDFDAVWDVRTANTPDGWTAEFRIPFSQMRVGASDKGGQVWGFGVRRSILRRSETGEWTAKPRGERGEVSRWGHLVFDTRVAPPRRVEWQPYVLAGATHVPATAATGTASAGLDLRVGLGASTTLSATVNPDFAQVEQDPAVLNLTIFETFFPEKRPFFLEDSRTFVPSYGIFQLFHSRRIGRRPDRFALASGETAVDQPDKTTILGAVKLTGKGSGWTYGALTAVTGSESARVTGGIGPDAAAGEHDRLVEPTTSYNVVRLQRDIRNGSSNVGAIATGVVRSGDTDAYTGGVDYNLRWDRNRVSWNGHWVATHALVDGAMQTGSGGLTNFNVSHKHFSVFSHLDHFDRTFKVDDLGFFRSRANSTQLNGGFDLEQPDPWKAFRRIGLFVNGGQSWNDERLVFDRSAGIGGFAQFRNFWSVNVGVFRGFEVLDDLDTRGGPPIVRPAGTSMFAGIFSDSRKAWRLSMFGNGGTNAAGGWNVHTGPGLTLQPSGRLQTSVSMNVTVARDVPQWINNVDVNYDGATDYVYGTLDRRIVDVTFRTTYALHRDLTLQVFLQPFVAVGDYTDIRRLARPRSFEFEPIASYEEIYGNPDFNRKSLRGNVVLRWEYVRGSTLYVAWSMSTSDTSRPGAFSPLRDFGDAFRAPGTHTLLVKASYWLSR
jgi:hypothetical protein